VYVGVSTVAVCKYLGVCSELLGMTFRFESERALLFNPLKIVLFFGYAHTHTYTHCTHTYAHTHTHIHIRTPHKNAYAYSQEKSPSSGAMEIE